jgi:hypothetical protein
MDSTDLFKNLSLGSGLSSIVGGIAGLFGNKNKNNPVNAAMPYLNQIPGTLAPYFNPFIDAGQRLSPGLEQRYRQLSSNPGGVYNELASGYKESPAYQLRLKEALRGAGNAQAAGGTLGTPLHQLLASRIGTEVQGADLDNYIKMVLGLMNEGLGGQENIVNRGYEAGTRYGENLGNLLGSQADLAFKGKAGQNLSNQQNWSNIFSGAANALPWLFGGA